ncbi:hypothetical protein V6N13_057919 [Hibiscus sabdariffa]|uniref:Uncharacterized protein n=1 Tax=Hibiscus sabdariffa TaxID=183260 RepID=A0ABR2GHQ0_9ROSI
MFHQSDIQTFLGISTWMSLSAMGKIGGFRVREMTEESEHPGRKVDWLAEQMQSSDQTVTTTRGDMDQNIIGIPSWVSFGRRIVFSCPDHYAKMFANRLLLNAIFDFLFLLGLAPSKAKSNNTWLGLSQQRASRIHKDAPNLQQQLLVESGIKDT